MRKFSKFICGALCSTIICIAAVVGYYSISLPDNYYVLNGENLYIRSRMNVTATHFDTAVSPASAVVGGSDAEKAQLKLFGIFPIKTVNIEKIDRPVLVPCGTPFGIKMLTNGIVVIGTGDVETDEGPISPAKKSGIKIGDVILSINEESVYSNNDISEKLSKTKDAEVTILLKRNEKEISINLKPVKSNTDGKWKAGLWVRDSSAGIGTVTFYDPVGKIFGGLGHGVCDVDTGLILPMLKGEIVAVAISGASKGTPGHPGELTGSFISKVAIGNLLYNTPCGVFGTMEYTPTLTPGIPMALKQEIKVGPAKILSTISGFTPKEYDIIIEKIDYNDKSMVKNMVIKAADPALIAATGGIAQGMSGSPIIQNNMLVGAVTHVFINDPTKGYAIFAENMYGQAVSGTADNAA